MKTTDYRHTGEKRTNIPPATDRRRGQGAQGPEGALPLQPAPAARLRFDPSWQGRPDSELIAEAGRRHAHVEGTAAAGRRATDSAAVARMGRQAGAARARLLRSRSSRAAHPRARLDAGDAPRRWRAKTSSAISSPIRSSRTPQAVQFYKHRVDWANRLILATRLQVMTSLARRENLAGKVQMIYIDPPYGIRFAVELPASKSASATSRTRSGPNARARDGGHTAILGRSAFIPTYRISVIDFVLAKELLAEPEASSSRSATRTSTAFERAGRGLWRRQLCAQSSLSRRHSGSEHATACQVSRLPSLVLRRTSAKRKYPAPV